jgi:hypothetical protein
MAITEDLANMTSIITFVVDQITTIALAFVSWPLILVPSVAVAGLVFAKAKGLMKLRR